MKYEYKLVHLVIYANGDVGTQELNEAGKDGWEAVNVSPWNSPPFVVLMKREIQDTPVKTEPVAEIKPEPAVKPKGKRNRYEV